MEWLFDNGSPYTAVETRRFAAQPGLVSCFTAVASPESNGMSEAFVKTIKRDHVRTPDAKAALDRIPGWLEDDNDNHPHSGLRMRSPRQLRRALQPAEVSAEAGQLQTVTFGAMPWIRFRDFAHALIEVA